MNTSKRNDMLKLIAIVTMIIDHTGLLFFPEYRIFRTIGRIAFPIFAYQVAVGFEKTSNRQKYQTRLLIFGLISQIPYMFLNETMELNMFHFNVLLLFFYSTLILSLVDKIKGETDIIIRLFNALAIVFMIATPEILSFITHNNLNAFEFSYNSYGIMLIIIFYISKEKYINILVLFMAITLFDTYLLGVKYVFYNSESWYGTKYTFLESLTNFKQVMKNILFVNGGLIILNGYFFQARSIFALPIIFKLSKHEFKIHFNKYFGYIIYPLHIIILLLIRLSF